MRRPDRCGQSEMEEDLKAAGPGRQTWAWPPGDSGGEVRAESMPGGALVGGSLATFFRQSRKNSRQITVPGDFFPPERKELPTDHGLWRLFSARAERTPDRSRSLATFFRQSEKNSRQITVPGDFFPPERKEVAAHGNWEGAFWGWMVVS